MFYCHWLWTYFKNFLLSPPLRIFLHPSVAVHETSKRLSHTLRDVYEADWKGVEDLPLITEVSLGCI